MTVEHPSATHGLVLTPAGYRDLQRELDELVRIRRSEAAERLQQAHELAGDLGDNPEYLEAERENELLERRIAVLEERLAAARVLDADAPPTTCVALGSWAEFEDVATGERSSYLLVSSAEANPSEGRLSVESPVGRTLLGHEAGETLEVTTPHGTRTLRILVAGRR